MKKYKNYILESYDDYDKLNISDEFITNYYQANEYPEEDKFSLKYSTYVESIEDNLSLQTQVFNYDNKNSIYLFNIIDDINKLTESYLFQKSYITTSAKLGDEDDIFNTILDLKRKYILNQTIQKEYYKYMDQITALDFNI